MQFKCMISNETEWKVRQHPHVCFTSVCVRACTCVCVFEIEKERKREIVCICIGMWVCVSVFEYE